MVRRLKGHSLARAQHQSQGRYSLGDVSTDKELERSYSASDIVNGSNQQRLTIASITNVKAHRRKPRKQLNPKQKDLRFWQEVVKLQVSTQTMMPRLPFSLLVREMIYSYSDCVSRITSSALNALQMATEMYITQIMQDAYLLTLHRGRVTLEVQDLVLIRLLRSHLC